MDTTRKTTCFKQERRKVGKTAARARSIVKEFKRLHINPDWLMEGKIIRFLRFFIHNWVMIPYKAGFFFLQVFLKRKADVKDELTFVIER